MSFLPPENSSMNCFFISSTKADFSKIAQPQFVGVKTFDVSVADLEEFIPWDMFFRTWGVKDRQAKEIQTFCADALAMLEKLKEIAKPKIRVGFFEASSVGDDIELSKDGKVVETLRMMRSQSENASGECLCFADYVAPKQSGISDYIGLYVATAGIEAEAFASSFKSSGDDYSYILVQTLCDAIAEALSVYSQKKIFSDTGEERAGVRSAVGYASYPDHSEKSKLAKLLSIEDSIGVSLTDNFMMTPKASVSAVWIANPSAKYFSAKVCADQLADFAQRKSCSVEEIEKYISVQIS